MSERTSEREKTRERLRAQYDLFAAARALSVLVCFFSERKEREKKIKRKMSTDS